MEIVSWIVWFLAALAGWMWSIAWLLLGGWVSTLLQILVIVFIVFAFKYGWRRAPLEIAQRTRPLAGWVWRWAMSREPRPWRADDGARGVAEVRVIRVKAPGDVNLSSLLNVVVLGGLALLRAI